MTIDQIVKSAGIQRKVDELGRITIPMEIRKNLGWGEKHVLEIVPTGEGIFIKSASFNPEKQKVVSELNSLLANNDQPEVYKAVQNALKYIGG